jgi:hypothetical protein
VLHKSEAAYCKTLVLELLQSTILSIRCPSELRHLYRLRCTTTAMVSHEYHNLNPSIISTNSTSHTFYRNMVGSSLTLRTVSPSLNSIQHNSVEQIARM